MNFNNQKNQEFRILDFPNSVYIILKEGYRKQLFNDLYRKNGGKMATARKLGIHLASIRTYENGFIKKADIISPSSIPIRILKKIIEPHNQIELEKNILSISSYNGLKVYNPILPIKESQGLYAIISHMLGDGSASKGKTPYYANTCKILRGQFIKDLQLFGKVSNYEKIPNTTPVIYFPKVITDILSYIFNITFTYPDRIPQELFKARKEYKISFLRALFDDEGTITTNLAICINNKNFLKQIKNLLKALDIETGKITKTPYNTKKGIKYKTSFNILKRSYMEFQKKINFSHPDKIRKLGFALKTANRQQRTRDPTFIEEKIIEILDVKPSTTMDLANKLFFTMSGILPHLSRLYKEKILIKKGYKNKIIWDLA